MRVLDATVPPASLLSAALTALVDP